MTRSPRTCPLTATTIVPHRPASKSIATGMYRFSRNPMYTGLAIMIAGGALASGRGDTTFFCPSDCLL
ncbi:MAG TPA: methyltransferase [Acidimicrobiales bacterium]|nr:methyltransferase [Acidimicrobiales bacterium]